VKKSKENPILYNQVQQKLLNKIQTVALVPINNMIIRRRRKKRTRRKIILRHRYQYCQKLQNFGPIPKHKKTKQRPIKKPKKIF
jgi:hypothetical protein